MHRRTVLSLVWKVGLLIAGLHAQPAYRQTLYEEAQNYTRRRSWDSALARWRSLLLIERDSAALALIHQQLGYVALHRGDSSEALRLWRQSLAFQPDYPIARQNYQWLYQKLRRPPDPMPPPYSRYAPRQTLSEHAEPQMGERAPDLRREVRWLSVERLQD